MPALMALANQHNLIVIEDCAEALGTTLAGQPVGTFGHVGTFSFFGNKTVTTGEGGMVICNDDALAASMRMVKGQGQSLTRRYWHEVAGFNYRMTNICAAIGLAQMERVDAILRRKRDIAAQYRDALAGTGVEFQVRRQDVESSDWLVSLLLPKGVDRDAVMSGMYASGIDTRPVFFCAHQMPMYANGQSLPVSEDIAARGLSLPSFPSLTPSEIARVVEALKTGLAG
jgi:perosamine synthetase